MVSSTAAESFTTLGEAARKAEAVAAVLTADAFKSTLPVGDADFPYAAPHHQS